MVKILPFHSVFWISILIEIISIASLRFIGIDWDYHVDAKTYAESSQIISKGIVENNPTKIVGNIYYFVVWRIFNQSNN